LKPGAGTGLAKSPADFPAGSQSLQRRHPAIATADIHPICGRTGRNLAGPGFAKPGAVPLAARSGHQERPDRAEGKLRAKRLDPAASDRRICRLSYMTGIPETCRPGRSQGNQIARTPIATSTIPAAWPSGLP
jgi:hypothetical protein